MYLDAACGSSLIIRRLQVVSQCRQPIAEHMCIHGEVFLDCNIRAAEAVLLWGTTSRSGISQNLNKTAASSTSCRGAGSMLVLPQDGTGWLCQGRLAGTLPNADDMCSEDSHRLVELDFRPQAAQSELQWKHLVMQCNDTRTWWCHRWHRVYNAAIAIHVRAMLQQHGSFSGAREGIPS
jgi:hypothetical protein